MISRRARLMNGVLRRIRAKGYVDDWLAARDPAEVQRLVKKRRRLDRHRPPRPGRGASRTTVDIGGWPLHIVTRPDPSPHRVMLYLHGGAYIIGPTGTEWANAVKLAAAAGCDAALWDYPKAPENDCEATLATTIEAYEHLAKNYGIDRVAVVGASAGGGLAASLLVALRESGQAPPAATVMLSPWLDLAMSNPEAVPLEALDHVLSIAGLRRDGELYGAARSPNDPAISPLFADPEGLGSMQVHVGTHEVFLPDCRSFAERVSDSGGRVELVIDPKGQHVAALFPTPEGKRLRARAAAFVAGNLGAVD